MDPGNFGSFCCSKNTDFECSMIHIIASSPYKCKLTNNKKSGFYYHLLKTEEDIAALLLK